MLGLPIPCSLTYPAQEWPHSGLRPQASAETDPQIAPKPKRDGAILRVDDNHCGWNHSASPCSVDAPDVDAGVQRASLTIAPPFVISTGLDDARCVLLSMPCVIAFFPKLDAFD